MDAKRRWSVLLLALTATVAAIAYPTEDEDELVDVIIPRSQPPLRQESRMASAPAADTQLAWVASDDDPFAVREWQAPPPPAAAPSQALPAAVPASPPPPPAPPPLPYKFVGQMNNDAVRTVYLARGDQVMLAHQGDVLDGSYKVIAIRPAEIEFEAVASGLKQTLAIPVQEN
jgi:hypothetical protein